MKTDMDNSDNEQYSGEQKVSSSGTCAADWWQEFEAEVEAIANVSRDTARGKAYANGLIDALNIFRGYKARRDTWREAAAGQIEQNAKDIERLFSRVSRLEHSRTEHALDDVPIEELEQSWPQGEDDPEWTDLVKRVAAIEQHLVERPPLVELDESLIGRIVYVSDRCMDGRWQVGSVTSCSARVRPTAWGGDFDWVAFQENIHLTEEHKLMGMAWHAHCDFCSALIDLKNHRKYMEQSPPDKREAPNGGTQKPTSGEAKE